jgi:uncharacterized protein (TIGR03067 family)
MKRRVLAVLLTLPLLGSGSSKEYDDRTEMTGIEGTWQLLAVEHDGKKVNPITWVLTFRRGRFTREDSNGGKGEGVYRFDSKQKPYHVDFIFEPGTNYASTSEIAEMHGDILSMAWDRSGQHRPGSFHDREIWIGTFKRLK